MSYASLGDCDGAKSVNLPDAGEDGGDVKEVFDTVRSLDDFCPLERQRTCRNSSHVTCASRGDCEKAENALGDAGEVGKNELIVQGISTDEV